MSKLVALKGTHNLNSYDEMKEFDWKEAEKQFTWYETGKLNIAYEAIDRHVLTDKKTKVANFNFR